MSLAQKFERLPSAKVEVLAPLAGQTVGALPPRSTVPIDFRNMARRPAPPPAAPVEPPAPDLADDFPTSEVALNLLGDVAKALPTLMARCQTLEDMVTATREQARADLEAATEVSREWQQIAHALKLQVEQLEKEVVAAKAQTDAAQQEQQRVLADASKSQKAAAEAECLASLFKQKVISSFGVGSESHSILETIRSRTQEMLTA